jgi:hypothetical protein
LDGSEARALHIRYGSFIKSDRDFSRFGIVCILKEFFNHSGPEIDVALSHLLKETSDRGCDVVLLPTRSTDFEGI